MSTTNTPYTERNFIIEDKIKTLFTLMKVIVDAGFPPLDDIRCLAMRTELYKHHRRYAYKELKDGSIYIHFPRINPVTWVIQHIIFYLFKREEEEDDEDDDEDSEMSQVQ